MGKRLAHSRAGWSYWPMIAFSAAFIVILFFVADRFLLPALKLTGGLDAAGKRQMVAISRLVLMVVLFCLLALLLLIFRPSRMLLPRKPSPRTRTNYIDAWEESARRLEPPPPPPAEDNRDEP